MISKVPTSPRKIVRKYSSMLLIKYFKWSERRSSTFLTKAKQRFSGYGIYITVLHLENQLDH